LRAAQGDLEKALAEKSRANEDLRAAQGDLDVPALRVLFRFWRQFRDAVEHAAAGHAAEHRSRGG
jgi:hypothetical protein